MRTEMEANEKMTAEELIKKFGVHHVEISSIETLESMEEAGAYGATAFLFMRADLEKKLKKIPGAMIIQEANHNPVYHGKRWDNVFHFPVAVIPDGWEKGDAAIFEQPTANKYELLFFKGRFTYPDHWMKAGNALENFVWGITISKIDYI